MPQIDPDKLTPHQRAICIEGGTEPPFSSPLVHEKRNGTYHCVACNTPLFSSTAKFDSGSGWPSFFQPLSDQVLSEQLDLSHGMRRVEVRCAACGSHLGHVFTDGPPPTGLRYCINGTALVFMPKP